MPKELMQEEEEEEKKVEDDVDLEGAKEHDDG